MKSFVAITKPSSFKKAAAIVGLILIIILIVASTLYLNDFLTILSLEKVDDHPLYSLTYHGDYDFDYTVEEADSAYFKQNGGRIMCSSFLALNEKGEPIFARNLDFPKHPAAFLFTNPPGKNASVAMTDLLYIGYSENNPPEKSWSKGEGLLATPRVPVDGMNEFGVAVAVLSVPHAEPPNDPGKKTADEAALTRLMLDNAKNLDEAISIIKQHNIGFTIGPTHFMIADSSGKSVVVEFLDNGIFITPNTKPWQVATNFIIHGAEAEMFNADARYNTANSMLRKANGRISEDEAMNILKQVAQSNTQWSVVYNLKSGEVKVAMGQKYNQIKKFKLDMKN
ncbi:MAG: linear amide C-N hydrolase [Clostridia bacterium]|nr:linear amide C-N hydrolase [Clostridia bacterium]